MNTEEALNTAMNILKRKEDLLEKCPRLYTLKADIKQWRGRVEELKAEHTEGLVLAKCDYCGVTLTKTTVEMQGYDSIFCSRRCAGKFCFGD